MAHERIIPLLNTNNFRDLGGYKTVNGQTVKWGRIFRSDKLDHLSTDDLKRFNQLNISTDIDLRSQEEAENAPDQLTDNVKYVHDPVFQQDETESSRTEEYLKEPVVTEPFTGKKHMQAVYKMFVNRPQSIQAIKKVFTELLSATDSTGTLFHCTAGKDRTGISAYLILRALGVSASTAQNDYLLTNIALKNFLRGQVAALRAAGNSETIINNYVALWSADQSYLNTALTSIQNQYGSVNQFLTGGLQLTTQDIQDLQKMYLDN